MPRRRPFHVPVLNHSRRAGHASEVIPLRPPLDLHAPPREAASFGVAGIAGSLPFARLYDGNHHPFILAVVGGLVAALALMLPVSTNPLAMMCVCMLWGASASAFNVALQDEVIAHTEPDESAVAMLICSGIFNLGIGCGS